MVKVTVIETNNEQKVCCEEIEDYTVSSCMNYLDLAEDVYNFNWLLTSEPNGINDVLMFSDEDGLEIYFIAPINSFSQQDVDSFMINLHLQLDQMDEEFEFTDEDDEESEEVDDEFKFTDE